MNLTITPQTHRTGADVIGPDLTRPRDAEDCAAPGCAFADHPDYEIVERRHLCSLMLGGEVPA